MIQGIGIAMLGEISFKNGRSQQTNFDGFELIRMDAAPREVKVHIVPSTDWNRPLGGVESRRTAGATGARQCDLRRYRKAHPAGADPRPGRRLGDASHLGGLHRRFAENTSVLDGP